jgi:pantothenate kinase
MPVEPADARGVVVGEARDLLDRRPGRVVLGITGPPGSGKSTLAQAVCDEFGPELAAYYPMDGFHLSNAQLERLGRRDRKGAPDTFDSAGYIATLRRIVEPGEEVYVPRFDRAVDEPVAAGLVIPAQARLVVTEGNYLALPTGGWSAVRPLIDRLYYRDTPPATLRARLLERHSRVRTPADALQWVQTVDEPNAALIATSRERCDRVLS